jgi:ubiquinol-cytochrome c reductase iron-sulfur subunit
LAYERARREQNEATSARCRDRRGWCRWCRLRARPVRRIHESECRARAAGAPVEADISKLEPGALLRVKWRGKPVWVVHRSPEMLAACSTNDPKLVDPTSEVPQQPDYCKNPTRSIKPEYLVAIGICTHLGCSPTYRPEFGPDDLGADWKGGFHCPCHGSRFDLAARVFKNVPAPTNLVIPKHVYLNDTTILIGEDRGSA